MRNCSQPTRATLFSFLSFSLAISLTTSLSGEALARHHGKDAAAAPETKGATAAKESAQAKDAPLSFTRLGKGPSVVLLHGLGGDRAVWADEMMRLSAKYTVVAVDLPGHGMSPGPKAPVGQSTAPLIDLQNIAQRVAKLIRDERLAPAVVVGHSIGGQVAAWVPLVDRDAVRGVLLVDSPLAPLQFSESELTRLRADLKRDMISTLRKFFAPMTSSPKQLDKVVASAQRVSSAVFMGYIDSAKSSELDEKVSTIGVPVHLLAGSMLISDNNDQSKARLSLQAAGLTSIPTFTYDYFPTSKHWLFWDEPERFRDDMDRFLSTVTRPAVSATKGRPKL